MDLRNSEVFGVAVLLLIAIVAGVVGWGVSHFPHLWLPQVWNGVWVILGVIVGVVLFVIGVALEIGWLLSEAHSE